MKKRIFGFFSLLMILSFVSVDAFSENELEAGLNKLQKEVVLAEESHSVPIEKKTVISQKTVVSQDVQPRSPQKYQPQPTTYVEDSPLGASRVERMRRAREEAELATERKIVEKLELSRLKDEQERSSVLFGDRLKTLEGQEKIQVTPPTQLVQPAPTVVLPEASVVREASQEDVKEELVSAVRDELKSVQKKRHGAFYDEDYFSETRYYISGLVNVINYTSAVNMRTNWSAGGGLGIRLPDDAFIIEGSIFYTNYYLDDVFSFKEMDQINFEMALKYTFLPHLRIRPYVGGLASYTIRRYYEILEDAPGARRVGSREDVNSSAIEMGGLAGVEVMLYNRLSIGVDYRYVVPTTYWSETDTPAHRLYGENVTAVENQQYSIFSITARLNF